MGLLAFLPFEVSEGLGIDKVGVFEQGGAAGMLAIGGFLSHGAARERG
jgi:hypothetical protein